MKKKQLNSRKEINFLVRTFYEKVRKDDLIGSVFNSQIKDWDIHLERLTDFWETNLLFIRKYKGNPVHVHNEVDKVSKGTIEMLHFGRWLQLWFETIDDDFVGEHATLAKDRARRMSTNLFLKMYASRRS